MTDKKNGNTTSRREFLSLFKKKDEEMIKMLTPDGKLVQVPRSVIEKSDNRQKAKNKDIYSWMNNPTKNQ